MGGGGRLKTNCLCRPGQEGVVLCVLVQTVPRFSCGWVGGETKD